MKTEIKMNFDPNIAAEVGTNADIIYSNIKFWISTNKKNTSDYHFYQGKYWMYNSAQAFAEHFPYLTERQIRRCLVKLEEKGYVLSGNFNKMKYDRTKWYSISTRPMLPNGKLELTEPVDRETDMVTPIPNDKPNDKPYTSCTASQHVSEEEPSVPEQIVKKQTPKKHYDKFVGRFNEIFSRNFRTTTNMTSKFQTRMKTYTFEEIMTALERLGEWRWAHGENPSGWKATPDYLIRNDDQINKFLNMEEERTPGEFKKPNKQLAVEITLMAGLVTGVWDNSIKAIYGTELLPWMQKEGKTPEFDNTVDLLVRSIQSKQPALKVSELSWDIVISTYERYLKTCDELDIGPREEILTRGEKVLNEHRHT